MIKTRGKIGIGCGIVTLLCVICAIIVAHTIIKRWNEGVVTMTSTDVLVTSGVNIRLEEGNLVAICQLTNTSETVIHDAGYSARFTTADGQYFGSTLGSLPLINAHDSIQHIIKMSPAKEVKDASKVILKLELFLPTETDGNKETTTKSTLSSEGATSDER
jgi:hypothetical protein